MYLLTEHILVVLGVLAIAVSVVLAMQQPRSPQSSVAWILFIILVPYLAVPLFIALGFRKQRGHYPPLPSGPGSSAESEQACPVFTALGSPAPSPGNRIDFHDTPDIARTALEALLDGAQTRVDVLLYILERDDQGRAFTRRLTALARRGVAVRLSLDWLGALKRPRAELADFVAAGGELRYFSPFPAIFDRGRLNLRNHRKMVMVDGGKVWAGGRNVGWDYLASPPGIWNDLSFTVEGPLVADFAAVFRSDWVVAGGNPGDLRVQTAPAGKALLQLVPSGPDDPGDRLHDGLVAAIYRADRRVWIATPYYVPSEALSVALCVAARRGVDVRIYLPVKSNQWTADLARGGYVRAATAAGCRILGYSPGMLHAKAGIIDNMAWAGSANFDVRSMLLNFELAVFCHDSATLKGLENWFATLEPHTSQGLPVSGTARRLAEGIFRLGAPVL